ncbi:hypothetical protein ABZP36_010745 [Zizania latifolia]
MTRWELHHQATAAPRVPRLQAQLLVFLRSAQICRAKGQEKNGADLVDQNDKAHKKENTEEDVSKQKGKEEDKRYSSKGKEQLDFDNFSKSFSDEEDKVDIPDYIDDQSNDMAADNVGDESKQELSHMVVKKHTQKEAKSSLALSEEVINDLSPSKNIVKSKGLIKVGQGDFPNPMNLAIIPEVMHEANWDGDKKKKKKQEPAMAKRQSVRIRRDEIPIPIKAQQWADQKDDITCISKFTDFQDVNSSTLNLIARDAGIELGRDHEEIEQNGNSIKARGLA